MAAASPAIRLRRHAATAALLVLAGCVSTARPPAGRAATAAFDPLLFFAGRTEGHGLLTVALHRAVPTLVEGRGRIVDGAIVLEQTVRRGERPATSRRWTIRPLGGDRYAGTLTDATGPVTGEALGSRLHLAFAMRGGLCVEQWLSLRPGGAVADNVMLIRKLGLPVARLDERIARLPG